MNTMTIDPRFVPAQLNLMMRRRPVRRVGNKQQVAQRVVTWLRSWEKTLIAELAALGAGLEKAL
jgi:hypothetical protein